MTALRTVPIALRCLTHVLRAVGLALVVTGNLTAQQNRIELRRYNAESEVAFTNISSVRELSDGTLIVADRTEKRVVRVEWKPGEGTVIGRVGNGPGEYGSVGWLYPLGGDSTLLVDVYNSRWLMLNGARIVETLGAQHPLTKLLGTRLYGADRSGNVLGVRGYRFSGQSRIDGAADSLVVLMGKWPSQRADTIARIRGGGSAGFQRLRVPGRPLIVLGGNPLRSHDVPLLFPDGWVAVARNKPYRVDWRTPEGRWIRGSPLPFTPLKVDDRAKCIAMQRYYGAKPPCDPTILEGWPETFPPFATISSSSAKPILLAAPDGRLLIARFSAADSKNNYYDLIDRAGRLSGVITVGTNERLIGSGKSFVYSIITDDLGLQTVRRHPWLQ